MSRWLTCALSVALMISPFLKLPIVGLAGTAVPLCGTTDRYKTDHRVTFVSVRFAFGMLLKQLLANQQLLMVFLYHNISTMLRL